MEFVQIVLQVNLLNYLYFIDIKMLNFDLPLQLETQKNISHGG